MQATGPLCPRVPSLSRFGSDELDRLIPAGHLVTKRQKLYQVEDRKYPVKRIFCLEAADLMSSSRQISRVWLYASIIPFVDPAVGSGNEGKSVMEVLFILAEVSVAYLFGVFMGFEIGRRSGGVK